MIKYRIKNKSNYIFNIYTDSYSDGHRYHLKCNIEYDHSNHLFDVRYYLKGSYFLRYHFDALDRQNDPINLYLSLH